jgi:hypothetical protein
MHAAESCMPLPLFDGLWLRLRLWLQTRSCAPMTSAVTPFTFIRNIACQQSKVHHSIADIAMPSG